jgi:hypothetical protein
MQRTGISRVFVVVILALLVVGGAMVFVSFRGAPPDPKTAAAQAAAKQFLDDLGNGRVDAAYRLGSKAFQGKQQPGDLQLLSNQHPGLNRHNSVQFQPFVSSTTSDTGVVSVRFSGQVSGPGGIAPFDIALVQENTEWKVDAFTVQGTRP